MTAWVKQKGQGDALLNLDFTKAYDMLDWNLYTTCYMPGYLKTNGYNELKFY